MVTMYTRVLSICPRYYQFCCPRYVTGLASVPGCQITAVTQECKNTSGNKDHIGQCRVTEGAVTVWANEMPSNIRIQNLTIYHLRSIDIWIRLMHCAAWWRHMTARVWVNIASVMACWLTAPGHYLNQCWQVISEVSLYSPQGNFTGNYWRNLFVQWVLKLII